MRRKWIYLACLLAGAAAWNGNPACAQTDIAASIDGAFSGATQSGVDVQRPSNSAGGLLEVRHIHNAHTITSNWLISRKMHNFRPFALAGGGLLLVVPSGGQTYTTSATEFLFTFGAGLDWGISSHLGLRLQDR